MLDQQIRLRETNLADLPFIIQAENRSENKPHILGWSVNHHREALHDPCQAHLLIERTLDSHPVGFAILILHPEHECVEFRRIVVTAKGKGYGRAAVRMIKDMVFNDLKAHRLWLDVMEHNTRARYLYESEGFRVEGRLRDCVKQGETFRSLFIMSLLAHEYHAGDATDRPHRCLGNS